MVAMRETALTKHLVTQPFKKLNHWWSIEDHHQYVCTPIVVYHVKPIKFSRKLLFFMNYNVGVTVALTNNCFTLGVICPLGIALFEVKAIAVV